MSGAEFTPGPWHVNNGGTSVGADLGGPFRLVASVYGDREDCAPDERMKANARLIAAAPELLSALQRFSDFADALSEIVPDNMALGLLTDGLAIGPCAPTVGDLRAARAAIAKATQP